MRTNFVQTCNTSANRINLNRTAMRVALIGLFISLSITNAWANSGGSTTYYSRAGVKVASGSGTVYVKKGATAASASSYDKTTNGTSFVYTDDASSTTQNFTTNFAICAVPATDYRFDGWTLSGSGSWGTNPNTTLASTYGVVKGAATSGGNSATTGTAAASFVQISIASVTPTSETLSPTDARTTCGDYTGTVTFTTMNDNAAAQIGAPTFGSTTGSGTWEATNSWTAGTSTVTYTFKGNGYYGGSGTASGSRNNSATLTLPTAGGTSSKSVTFTANFPALVIADGETDVVSPKGPKDDGDGAVTFDVTYFDGLFDIANVVISEETGGTWTLGTKSFESTNAATGAGEVTVPFTFNAGGATGDFTAKLTLTPDANTGASVKVVTLMAHVDGISSNDASVTPAGGSATEYATFAEALAAANTADGCTIKLLRDVGGITTSQEIKKTMTLDLNRFSLSGTLSSAGGLLKLNTAGKTLTITDTQSGGKISVSGNINGRISAVDIQKGSLVLTKGDLIAENANTGTTAANIYCATVYLATGTSMSMTNGSISAKRTGASGNYSYGIYGAGTSSLNLSGSSVTAENANGGYAEGVYTEGNASISNMTISGSSKTYAYAIWDANGHVEVNGGVYSGTTSANGARAIYTKTAPATAGSLTVTNAILNATAETTDAKGVYCQSTSTATSDDPKSPNIALSGVTVNTESEGTTDAYAIYTDAGVSLLVNSGTYTATAKTTTATAVRSGGYTAVLGGTFNATATTTTARGLHVAANIAAVKGGTFTAVASTDLANGADIESGAKLLTYGGAFTGRLTKIAASKYAIGANVKVGGTLEAQGGTFVGEAANSTLTAKQTSFACGVYGVEGKSTINMSNATMRGELQSNYLSNGTDSQWNGGAYGFYSRSSNPCGLTNCTITATSAYQGGFGLRFAYTPVEIRNCTVTVNTTYAYNYGIFEGGACDVKVYNSNFTCTSGTTWAYGIYAYNGTIYAENSTFDVTTQRTGASSADNCNLYGVKVNSGKSATLNGCAINATGSGQYSNNGYGIYVDGTAEIEDCKVTVSNINSGAYAICNTGSTTRIGVASGKFKATATSTAVSTNGTAAAAKQQLYGGFYNTNNNLEKYLPEGYGIEILSSGSTEYGEGYRYAIRPSTNLNPVCKIGSTPYYTLEEALEFVNKNSGTEYTILMTADYTLPAGDYTLPAKATLLVPKKDQTSFEAHPTRVAKSTAWAAPTCNRKLTFAANANLVVWGKVQTGGVQAAVNQMPGHNGVPRDTYGHIVLNASSTMILESGSHLYSWGYITGAGAIDAKRGSTVHENLQIRDWRGGTCTSNMNGNDDKVFPLNQYSIQNIEAAITFHPGSAEKCDGTVNARTGLFDGTMKAYTFEDVNLIGITGSGSLFMMDNEDNSADTWVRKYYDVARDMQVYELNSSANLGSLSLSLYGISFNSVSYVLPLTNNMHIHLLSGTMHITQDTEVLPGAIIEIDKEATAYVDNGKSLYIFDADEWDAFPNTKYFYLLAYSATLGKAPTARSESTKPADAAFYLHGKLQVEGKIYTTSSGANIYSTNEDAGQVHFVNSAPSTTTTVYVANNTGPTYNAKTADPARLKNGDGTYEPTSGTVAGKTWVYTDDKWKCWDIDGCFIRDAQNNPYAHPSDYVRLTNEPDANHLYKAYASDRYFIWDASCQWWEIDPSLIAAGEYKAIKADHNGKYNYYEYDSTNKYWKIKVVTITWKNGSTTLGTYANVGYKTHPKYLEATPKINATSTEYYTWLGWTMGSEEGEFFAKDAELPVVKANTTFYAYFDTLKYSYAVVFKNYDGSILQTSSWEAGQVPYYLVETDPVKPATAAKVYTFTGWSPAFTAVTGSGQVYTAQFDPGTPRTYTIQWVNYDGTVLKEEQVTYGTTPSAPVTPTRPNDTYYTYTFDAWSPEVSAVTGNQTYTATYNYEMKVTKYTINFKNGSTTLYSQYLPSGETPEFGGSTPTKDDAAYEYTFDGWSATEGGEKITGSLPTVSADANYFALFTHTPKRYTIRWKSEDGKVLYETDTDVPYGATPKYNGSKLTKARQGATVFTFDGWSSTIGGAKIALPAVSADATYYAHFSDDPVYTVTFDANGHGTAPSSQEVGENQPVIEPAAPAAAEWIFGGWYKEAECTNVWNFASDVITADRVLYAKWTPAVASVTVNSATTYYATIDDAFTAANSSVTYAPTITLLRDASTTTTTFISYTGARNCTLNLNGHTLSSTTAQALLYINMEGITFTITDLTDTQSGTLNLQSTSTSNRWCVYVANGNLQMDAGTVFLRSKADQFNEGIRIDPAASTFTMNGGKVHVVTSDSKPACGIVSKGIAVINGGEIQVETSGTGYGIEARNTTGNVTVSDGKFLVTGTTDACAYKSAANATLKLQGGYYNTNTNLEANCETNYHVLPLTGEDPYKYEVAEAYQLAWNLDGGTVVTAGTQAPVNATGTPSGYVAKGATLTAPVVEKTGYTFDGWNTSGGTAAATMPAANTTYTATWTVAESGFWLDIVDVNNSTNKLTINTNSWASAGWPYTINDDVYEKNDREADRTLIIPYTGEVGATFAITVTNKNSVIVSKHNYIIPAEITANANLADQQILYVKSGATLTVNVDKTVKNIYVAPGAKMVVNNDITLTADTVFLRTTPWASAELELDGTISGQVCYTRIIKKKDQYYQFGIPMPCAIDDVRLSDGSTPVYGNGWLLRSYSEQHRAQYGSGAGIDNWVTLTNEGADINKTIQGCVGYEMFSNSGYYREYYFPVAHTGLSDRIAVNRTTDATVGAAQEGWNIIVSPLMQTYTQSPAPEGATLSWLQEDGSYWQSPVTEIKPAIPFSYQATQTGYIVFNSNISLPAPQRRVAAAEEYKQIQWLQLDLIGANGKLDETSIYAHPTRYEQTYQTGIDVAKQSLTATRALIYSSHAYGEMAFAGVADVLLENGVALTVYSPKAQELTISMRNNEWLNRMAFVWLIDQATGAQIDLLESDYSFNAEAGTTAGRFILMGAFFAPQITTDNGNVQSDEDIKATKFIYNDKMYIQINGVIYDATGKLVK